MSKRSISKTVKFSPEELAKIKEKADKVNSKPAHYIRTMALDGEVYFLESPEHREIITEMHRIGANINQIAQRLNETGSLYYADMENIREEHDNLCRILSQYLSTLRLKKL